MYLGFDTSNYTTSLALFDGENVISKKQILRVKDGEKGLRQSEAVFQHTVNMPKLLSQLPKLSKIDAVAVSSRPRNVEGSYMPCFLVGVNNAQTVSTVAGCDMYCTSHQVGHILSALYSIDRLDLINEEFIAFHISGGTTQALLVKPDKDEIIKINLICESLDLKAGQAVDRTGVMLGLHFPCGKELDKLSLESSAVFKYKPTIIDGNCSMSGIENKVKKMIDDNFSPQDISKFLFTSISNTIEEMTKYIIKKYPGLPLVYAGGVMSNTIIRNNIKSKFNAYFALPEFSCDNAVGTAIYAYLKSNEQYNNSNTTE